MSLTACGTVASKLSGAACPSLPVYTLEVRATAANELDSLPLGSIIATIMMPDYAKMRAGTRECIKAQALDSK